jgi:putative transposase
LRPAHFGSYLRLSLPAGAARKSIILHLRGGNPGIYAGEEPRLSLLGVDNDAKSYYINGEMISDAAFRYRFYPTPAQADFLNRTFGCVRVVYNRARAMREEAWSRKERVGFIQTNAMLTKLKKNESFAWLSEVSSVPLQQALRHLDAAYVAFFRKRSRYPRFRSKVGPQSAEFTKSGFKYRDGAITLAKMDAPLDVRWSRELPSEPSTVTVMREADGRWFVSCRALHYTEELTGGGEVGIDLGLTHFATLSTGEKIENPRHLLKRQKKLARAQRRVARKKKGSNNRRKAALKVARLHSAVRNARQDFLHQLTTKLIRENQTICLETLSVKGMLRTKLHSRSISDAGWSEFVRQLSYKAVWYGRQVARIGRWHPSTKTCGACGTTGHKLALSDRAWTCCNCGTAHDRDINAARNILAEGLSVIACGGGVNPGVSRHDGLSPMKQELVL